MIEEVWTKKSCITVIVVLQNWTSVLTKLLAGIVFGFARVHSDNKQIVSDPYINLTLDMAENVAQVNAEVQF